LRRKIPPRRRNDAPRRVQERRANRRRSRPANRSASLHPGQNGVIVQLFIASGGCALTKRDSGKCCCICSRSPGGCSTPRSRSVVNVYLRDWNLGVWHPHSPSGCNINFIKRIRQFCIPNGVDQIARIKTTDRLKVCAGYLRRGPWSIAWQSIDPLRLTHGSTKLLRRTKNCLRVFRLKRLQ
jgi:hypothetical protein